MSVDSCCTHVLKLDLDSEIIESLNNISESTGQSTDVIVSDLIRNYNEEYTSKMRTVICNDFSLDMLSEDCNISIKRISLKDVNNIIDNSSFECTIGNKKIADYLGLFEYKQNIVLDKFTRLIVAKPINDITVTETSDLKFKFYEIKYDGVWSYDWVNIN